MLKRIRQILAVLILAGITFYFLDFSGILSHNFHSLAHIQLVPAIIAVSLGILTVLILLTLISGRTYCSVICPLGIFQDVIGRISRLFNKKKRFKYIAENKLLRFSVLAFFIICFIFNSAFLVGLLDPYSIYGRIVTNLFRPVYLLINNGLAFIFNSFGNYSLYRINVYVVSVSSLIISLVSLLIIGILAFRNGRIYCNTFCPVGTGLGYLSKFSLFKIRMNKESCNACGLCAMKCKASCIDSKSKTVDHTRCVTCFNCLSSCRKGALSYSFRKAEKALPEEKKVDDARRRFVALSALTVLSAGKAKAQEIKQTILTGKSPKKLPIVPPGGKSIDHLISRCTACHLCVSKCPSKVIKPAFMEYGFNGIMLPMMTYEHGFCNFDCTVCTSICPANALAKTTKEEKHVLKIGEVNFTLEHCIVYTDNTSCGACSEHCPTQAVSMVDYKDGLTIPFIKQEICVGCGGCEFVCPSVPIKAIYVEGLKKHEEAKAIEKKETEEVELNDFGF